MMRDWTWEVGVRDDLGKKLEVDAKRLIGLLIC